MTESSTQLSDDDLVEQMRAGNERALSTLYDRHAEVLYSAAMALLGDSADAEEVVADAFLRLWRRSDYREARGSVAAYLTVIARSRALDRIRTRRRRGRVEEEGAARDPSGFLLPVADAGDAPERRVELAETRARVRSALAALSDKQRAVIDLAYFDGLTHSEIAERLAEPLGTVKTRLRDGMRKLRDTIPLTPTGAR